MVRQIFNEIVKQNEFYFVACRRVRIKVIHKKGDAENVSNYRPICSLPARKTPQKQTTFRSPKGNEKQIDYMLIERRYLRYSKVAEANDMIHMGSDHRCVMATEKSSHYKTLKGEHDIIKHEGRDQTGQKLKLRILSSKKYQEIMEKIKKPPPQKRSSASRKRKCRSTSKK